MKIELKRVTYNSRLSEETAAFAADLWINGKKRGDVLNDGHGGPDRIHPYTLAQEIEAYAATLPKWKSPWGVVLVSVPCLARWRQADPPVRSGSDAWHPER